MEGVGIDGRMFLLKRPGLEEQISSLWGLYHHTLKENAELQSRLDWGLRETTCDDWSVRDGVHNICTA